MQSKVLAQLAFGLLLMLFAYGVTFVGGIALQVKAFRTVDELCLFALIVGGITFGFYCLTIVIRNAK